MIMIHQVLMDVHHNVKLKNTGLVLDNPQFVLLFVGMDLSEEWKFVMITTMI